MSDSVYRIVTDQIIKALENGVIPWEKPFLGHMNLISKKEYRGVNILLLALSHAESPYWLTYNQAQGLKGNVKKGEHGKVVTFFKIHEGKDKATDKAFKFPLLRYYRVFNATQCEGIKTPSPVLNNSIGSAIEECDKVIERMPKKPVFTHEVDSAHYIPSKDVVNIPEKAFFKSIEDYYATVFHELIHSTMHESRLDREHGAKFGSESYAKEELVAELGAAFLCSRLGIPAKQIENRAAYIATWIKRLKNDTKMIVSAASQAQKATEYILGDLEPVEIEVLSEGVSV